MNTVLAISFPWGRYHATPWERGVNEAAVEWPPSPWRILRALYATHKTRVPQLSDESVRGLLGKLAEKPDYFLPVHAQAHTRHYYPDEKDGTDKILDAFVVLERDEQIFVRWPIALDSEERSVFEELAENLPYLGRADSICLARVLTADEEDSLKEGHLGRCAPEGVEGNARKDPSESVQLLVPDEPLDIEALTVRSRDLRKAKQIDPPSATRVTYSCPPPGKPLISSPTLLKRQPITAIRWAIATNARPSRFAALAMAEALRQASLSASGRLNDGGPSAGLAGKDRNGVPLREHGHAHYFAFVADPLRIGPGRLDTLAVWLPAGISDDELAALGSLWRLGGRSFISDFRPCRLGLEAYGEIEQVVPELCRSSKTWESFTPFAPPRHGRRRDPWAAHVARQVSEELVRRGKPPSADVQLLRGDWLNFRRHRLRERLTDARRSFGIRVTFDEPVSGPLSLGALSHFGLGLMVPTA